VNIVKKIAVPLVCVLVLSLLPVIGSASGPDLKVTQLTSVKDENSNTTTVTAIVKNVGDQGTGNGFYTELNVTSKGVGGGTIKSSKKRHSSRIDPNVATTVSWVFSGIGWDNAHAIADVDGDVAESNENNNSKGTCNFAYIEDFEGTFDTMLDVGNITMYPQDVELVIDYVSPGLTVMLDPSVVFLEVGEVTQVLMTVEFAPGVSEGEVVILGIYSDGYTVSPAVIHFIDINP
jgi:hypothetical protein